MSKHGHTRRRLVQVSASGRASATPDVVRLSLGIRSDGDDVSSALRDVGDKVTSIGEAVRGHGVESADIRSTGAGVHPRYDRDGQRVVGYQAQHSLAVVVRALDTVGAVVDSVAQAAGNSLSVDSIQLELSDSTRMEQEARDNAFAHARSKGDLYARLSGGQLGEVLSVVEGGTGGGPAPVGRMAMMASSSPMPVEAGETTVTASVTVTWALED
ncbi:MAG: SIMPL domain-containing protein [Actinomycetota bacterium]|nr:SIMPL domain-containing protein [Actinomycetota bacterium]